MAQERVQRVAEEIKKEIGAIIHDEVKDPRIGFVTVTRVDLSRDLRLAKVYFSILGTEKQTKDTQIGLGRSQGFIRKLLGERLKLRYTPELVFKLDQNIAYSIRIEKVLNQIKEKERANERRKGN